MEGESKLLLGKEEIKIKAGEMTFEGAELKGGSFTFKENSKNWKKISYKEGKLETSSGTFFVKGFLQQGKNKLEIIMRIYLEPIEKGFKMEVRYLSLDSKRKNSKFPIGDFKGIFKGVKKDPS
ncbi:MAG: hypothetical protein NXH75_06905 [Halobacteriovoraceae bacterium]|nr:hypothetical protein [Halobacteriovoraceae bacterium]